MPPIHTAINNLSGLSESQYVPYESGDFWLAYLSTNNLYGDFFTGERLLASNITDFIILENTLIDNSYFMYVLEQGIIYKYNLSLNISNNTYNTTLEYSIPETNVLFFDSKVDADGNHRIIFLDTSNTLYVYILSEENVLINSYNWDLDANVGFLNILFDQGDVNLFTIYYTDEDDSGNIYLITYEITDPSILMTPVSGTYKTWITIDISNISIDLGSTSLLVDGIPYNFLVYPLLEEIRFRFKKEDIGSTYLITLDDNVDIFVAGNFRLISSAKRTTFISASKSQKYKTGNNGNAKFDTEGLGAPGVYYNMVDKS